MALGKIKADTLEHSTAGAVDTLYVVNGSAKAFALWNSASTPAYRGSFNMGSITDHGTGDQTVAFVASMANANFTTSGQVGNGNDGDASNAQMRRGSSATGSQRCTIQFATSASNANYDYTYVGLVIHGELA
tara:strand:+ start:1235 stop:1630 length:396 start_codon:yes stop_codon:yes gene_type:complete